MNRKYVTSDESRVDKVHIFYFLTVIFYHRMMCASLSVQCVNIPCIQLENIPLVRTANIILTEKCVTTLKLETHGSQNGSRLDTHMNLKRSL